SWQVVSQTDALGRISSYGYSAGAGQVGTGAASFTTTTVTSPASSQFPNGVQTVSKYVNYVLVSTVDGANTPQAATTTFAYDPQTLGKSSVTDPDGHMATTVRDAQGEVTQSTDALGRTS